ncbi:MAG: hypothetical protein FGF50_10780 [Candidatus Brockarchaeota archaeon]|nr:hypothetical protein [Candidatus Brockarchaeota archaeon]
MSLSSANTVIVVAFLPIHSIKASETSLSTILLSIVLNLTFSVGLMPSFSSLLRLTHVYVLPVSARRSNSKLLDSS